MIDIIKLRKVAGSVVATIPQVILLASRFKEGERVSIEVDGPKIIIRKLVPTSVGKKAKITS